MKTVKFEEFVKMNIDVDVIGTLTDEVCIAYVGPMELTKEGKECFSKLLKAKVELEDGGYEAVVHTDTEEEEELLLEFLECAAGYCSNSAWNRYFVDEESDEQKLFLVIEDYTESCGEYYKTLIVAKDETEASQIMDDHPKDYPPTTREVIEMNPSKMSSGIFAEYIVND